MTKGVVCRGLQDGMLAWYKSQASFSDVSIERKVDSESFDFRRLMPSDLAVAAKARDLAKRNEVRNWRDLINIARDALIDASGEENNGIAEAIQAVKMRGNQR